MELLIIIHQHDIVRMGVRTSGNVRVSHKHVLEKCVFYILRDICCLAASAAVFCTQPYMILLKYGEI